MSIIFDWLSETKPWKWLETRFWKIAKWIIIKGYGCDCKKRDIDEEMFAEPNDMRDWLKNGSRCPSCKAKEVVEWIEKHISLLE